MNDGATNAHRAAKLGQPAPAAPWSTTDRMLRVAVGVAVLAANLAILALLVPAVGVLVSGSLHGVQDIREHVVPPHR